MKIEPITFRAYSRKFESIGHNSWPQYFLCYDSVKLKIKYTYHSPKWKSSQQHSCLRPYVHARRRPQSNLKYHLVSFLYDILLKKLYISSYVPASEWKSNS